MLDEGVLGWRLREEAMAGGRLALTPLRDYKNEHLLWMRECQLKKLPQKVPHLAAKTATIYRIHMYEIWYFL